MLLCQRDNHAAGSLGVPMTTVSSLHHVPNVAGIADHVLIPTHPQADAPNVFAAGKLHFESVRGDAPGAVLGSHSLGEDELQVTIHRERKIKKLKEFRVRHSLDTLESRTREAVMIRHRHTAPCCACTEQGSLGLYPLLRSYWARTSSAEINRFFLKKLAIGDSQVHAVVHFEGPAP